MPRAVLVLEERPHAADRPPPLAPGRVVVVAVSGPVGRATAAGIGLRSVVIEDDGLPESLGALVDLRALDAPADLEGALASAKASLFLAQRARPALLESARAGGAFYAVVTRLAASHPVTGAVHGLLKTAALEWPEVACVVVDVDPALDAGAVVAAELRTGFQDVEVVRRPAGAGAGAGAGARAGARFVPVVRDQPVTRGPVGRVSSSSVWVASGGARGVTATTLLALAKATRPALLLLGRTPLAPEPTGLAAATDEAALKRALVEEMKAAGRPIQLAAIGEEARRVLAVREIASFVAALERAGARVMYRAVDVRDAAEVARACAEARATFGPITGIVHGAGVLADRRIEDKTAEQVDRVMDTKVKGLAALLAATGADPLDTVVLFSSVAGRFGNVGQVDYAMANEALNEMAVRLAATEPAPLVVKSLNWGPWEGGMVTPALKKVFLERGVRVLSHPDGARHFVDELSADDGAVEVIFGGELAPTAPTAQTAQTVQAAAPTATAPTTLTTDLVSPPRPPRGRRFHLDHHGWPFLADHAVKGVVVLPVVGALELFAETTSARVFEDVRVLRGVKLPGFLGAGDDLEVVRDGPRVSLFVANDETPSYTARVGAPGPLPAACPRPDVAPPSFGDVYDGLLFHGERFHLVDVVEGASRAGLVARVRGCLERDWGDSLALDMGALDAALQAALLWARHATRGAFLPTAIARVHAGEPVSGPLGCVLVGRSLDDVRGVCDVQLTDMAGRVVFALEGVEVHRLGDDAAFARAAPVPRAAATRAVRLPTDVTS